MFTMCRLRRYYIDLSNKFNTFTTNFVYIFDETFAFLVLFAFFNLFVGLFHHFRVRQKPLLGLPAL